MGARLSEDNGRAILLHNLVKESLHSIGWLFIAVAKYNKVLARGTRSTW